VERGVEDRDVRSPGQGRPREPEPAERRRVVQRGEVGELRQALLARVVEQDRVAEDGTAVDDAVADGGDVVRGVLQLVERLDPAVRIDERQLEARRPGVDHEHAAHRGHDQPLTSGRSSPCSRV
jgi:hypothetical protein